MELAIVPATANTTVMPSATVVKVRKLNGSSGAEGGDILAGFDPESNGHSDRQDLVDERGVMEYCGWVYHLGTNSLGHEFCHLRFLVVLGKRVFMYKRDPQSNPNTAPIRKGSVGKTFMVEEPGRRRFNDADLYVIRFYNRLDEAKKGEIACCSAGEAQTWKEAFEQAKQHAEYELSTGASSRHKLNVEAEITLEGHRPRVRRYAKELRKLIRIGQGPEALVRRSSTVKHTIKSEGSLGGNSSGDVVEAQEWRCVRTINGVRIFEDITDSKRGKGSLVKAVTTIDAAADSILDVLLNVDPRQRYEWDVLSGDLELIDSYDGHYDVVHGVYNPKYLARWQSRRDFVFSRQWFRAQNETYTILQYPAVHTKRPPMKGYRRISLNPLTWEIKNLDISGGSRQAKSLVTQMLEVHEPGWRTWKKQSSSKFEKSVVFALLSQLSGLKEYIGANSALKSVASRTIVTPKFSNGVMSDDEYEDAQGDEFYDAINDEDSSSSSDEEIESDVSSKMDAKVRFKNVSWAIASLAVKRKTNLIENKELDYSVPPVTIDASKFQSSLPKGTKDKESNCWASPNGSGFMIRGKNYLKDFSKIVGGEPLLTLLGVDWFEITTASDRIALNPRCLTQTDAGKKLPFVLVINLQIPAKPNYSLVLYYGSDRPVNKNFLLGKFVDGTDTFRNSTFKLIPSIVEGYWMVKRAVGTKACLLGKAVTCNYFRANNFLEIDVDIGSSSVARGIIGLVLGYVTSIVVDLAILIEAKEEEELPEYILGTVRLNRLKLETAVKLDS